ncbi:MAG: ArsR/SmtB family transcription factor [Geminicoccaceae bacterium]
MANQTEHLDRIFHALADPTRRGIVKRLIRGPASVSELAKPLSMALPTVVQHLRDLEESGLVRSTKKGRVRTCEVETAVLSDAGSWIAEQKALWQTRFDRLEAFLERSEEETDGDDG